MRLKHFIKVFIKGGMCFKVVWEGYYKIMALEFYLSHQISFSQHYLKLFLTFKLPHVLKSSCLEANKWKEGSLSREVVSDSSLKNEGRVLQFNKWKNYFKDKKPAVQRQAGMT